MRKVLQLFAFAMGLMCLSIPADAQETRHCNHSKARSRHNFFPCVRFVLTPVFLENDSAVSLLAEVGPRNYRLNGTYGFFSNEQHRFKFSGEYLAEKLQYKFESGKTRRWMHQLGLGGKYQYWFQCPGIIKGLQLHGVYSNSYNHKLGRVHCTSENLTLKRRIAGAWFYAVEGGVVLTPWECGTFVASISYDQVQYKRQHQSKHRVSGVGATFELTQKLAYDYTLVARAEFKRPFNYLEALLSWNHQCGCGDLTLGIFGSHTWGKSRLPSATSAGIELGFNFGVTGLNCGTSPCCDPCGVSCYDPCAPVCCDRGDLAAWVASPAVYMPIVLAIADEKTRRNCVTPGVSSTGIPNQVIQPGQTFAIQTASAFNANGNVLTFSATGLPAGATIDPNTGVITGRNPGIGESVSTVTVTATSACGSASQTFILTYLAGA